MFLETASYILYVQPRLDLDHNLLLRKKILIIFHLLFNLQNIPIDICSVSDF